MTSLKSSNYNSPVGFCCCPSLIPSSGRHDGPFCSGPFFSSSVLGSALHFATASVLSIVLRHWRYSLTASFSLSYFILSAFGHLSLLTKWAVTVQRIFIAFPSLFTLVNLESASLPAEMVSRASVGFGIPAGCFVCLLLVWFL